MVQNLSSSSLSDSVKIGLIKRLLEILDILHISPTMSMDFYISMNIVMGPPIPLFIVNNSAVLLTTRRNYFRVMKKEDPELLDILISLVSNFGLAHADQDPEQGEEDATEKGRM